MLSRAAIGATFGTARAITHVLRRRDSSSSGSGALTIAGCHLHHYKLSIALLTGVGGIAVHGQAPHRRHPSPPPPTAPGRPSSSTNSRC